jgi:hypothetical protein
VKGQVPLFEAIRCSRELLKSLSGVRTTRGQKLEALQSSFAFSFRSFCPAFDRQRADRSPRGAPYLSGSVLVVEKGSKLLLVLDQPLAGADLFE